MPASPETRLRYVPPLGSPDTASSVDGGEVTFSIAAASGNMAKMIYGAEDREVGNGASEDVN